MAVTDISVLKNNQLQLDGFKPKCCDDKHLFDEIYQGMRNIKDNTD